MKRYSLANYILTIEPEDEALRPIGSISIGGEGSHVGQVSLSNTESLWSTTSFATGAWVHNKNLSRTGTVTVQLNQLSDIVAKLKTLCNMYYQSDYAGLTITLSNNNGDKIATCVDCLPTKIADQEFGESASNQTWSFTAGQITYD